MRCDNCGWGNAEGITHCIKCNTKLEESKPGVAKNNAGFTGTISESTSSNIEKQGMNYPSNYKTEMPIPTSGTADLITCLNPACGYLYSAELSVCPKCSQPVNTFPLANTISDLAFSKNENTVSFDKTKKVADGTIDPYRRNFNALVICSLNMVAKEKEQMEPHDQIKTFVFKNEPIILNRNNLDELNNSITSKLQAELVYEDGKWFLSDRSELKTTFINVNEKTELKEGDLILMGDRKFIFSIKDSKEPAE